MLVVPLMTCSARLPVYTLIIASLFPPAEDAGGWPVQGLLMMALYLFSVVVALLAAAVLGRTVLKGPRVPLLLELPPYRVPLLRTTLRLMRLRAGEFLKEAGTVILACTVLMWALLKYPALPPPADYDTLPAASQAAFDAARLEHSAAGRVGKAIEPAIAPLGFDWKIGVGVIGAFAAREVFVSTMAVVFNAEAKDDDTTPLRQAMLAAKWPDGRALFTPLVCFTLMIFYVFAMQCVSTIAVVRRETNGWKWPLFQTAYMTGTAWILSFVVYQGGTALGF
jgi:ferrous iron transport protein B